MVHTVTTSANPAYALWQLWDAFFTTVATTPTSHAALLTLYLTLRAHPPTQPDGLPVASDAERQLRTYTHADGMLHWVTLPRFGSQWRDMHDILEARRDRTDVCVSSCGCDELYLQFCTFSALLLKTTNGKGEVHPIWVFYACRDPLECNADQPYPAKAHRISPEQMRALTIRVAAIWVREGGPMLWETRS